MPRCDGTGPDGQGPKTGRGLGLCNEEIKQRYTNYRRGLRRRRRGY